LCPPKPEQYANIVFLSSLVFVGRLGKAGGMRVDAFNAFAGSLPHTTHVVQWGGAHVWKIGGKVFAIGGWNKEDGAGVLSVSFKVTRLAFDILGEQDGLRPAPYLASRGMTWIQRTDDATMSDADLCAYLEESYRLVAAGLTKKRQRELGLPMRPMEGGVGRQDG
jgi:predicted DNA-binding protein (MmcQ/YjbR family)